MSHLNADELAEFREIFKLVDRDGSGTITKEELAELMETLGIDATQEEVDMMISEIDTDDNGSIDFDEFVSVMSRRVDATYSSTQVKDAFKLFTSTGSHAQTGHISTEALLRALTTYGTDKLTKEQAEELIKQLEPDENGMINYEEYVDMMMST